MRVVMKRLFFILILLLIIDVNAAVVENDLNRSKSSSTKVNISLAKQYDLSRYDAHSIVVQHQIDIGRISSGEKAIATAGQGIDITDKYIVITQNLDPWEEKFDAEHGPFLNPILIIDKNTLNILKEKSFAENLWHANDMTYNSRTNELVFLKRNDKFKDSNTGIVDSRIDGAFLTFYDSNTLALKQRAFALSNNNIKGGFAIAYNSSNNKYYYAWDSKIHILAPNFSLTGNYGTIVTNCKTVQSLEVINNKIYYLVVQNKHTPECTWTDGYSIDDTVIYEFDQATQYLKTYYIPSMSTSNYRIEAEGIAVDESTGSIYALFNRFPMVNGSAQTPANKLLLYKVDSKVNIQFHMNGGKLSEQHDSQYSTSDDYITRNGSTISHTIEYGKGFGSLLDYNNPKGLNIEKEGYTVPEGAHWKKSDGTVYDQYKEDYAALDFCSASLTDCTVDLFVNWIPVKYTLTYDLAGGTVSNNQTSYNIETNSFTLTNPTRDGYTFAGWSGTGITGTSTNVTISNGSTGNRTYTAKWIVDSKNISTPSTDSNKSIFLTIGGALLILFSAIVLYKRKQKK